MNNPWVIDASPLILLAKIDHLKCLYKTPQNLIIPQGVVEEVMAGERKDPARLWIESTAEAFTVVPEPSLSKIRQLGKGESAVLSWAYNHPESIALIDDLNARRVATSLGINFIGTLGVLLAAKNKGIISNITSPIDLLVSKGIRLHPNVIKEVKRLAGEGESL